MPAVSRFEREGAVRGRGARVELARLGHGAARQLGAADARGEAEVVLDPPGRPGLAAERGALHDERVEPFGGAVDRGREACRAGAHDQEVDLLARLQLEPDPERAQHLAGAGTAQLASAGQPHQRQGAAPGRGRVLPGVREPVRACEIEDPHRRLGAHRADDLEADPLHGLQRLAAGDERGQEQVAERAVLVEERAQLGALDRDVAQRLDHERVDEDRLPRQEVQLAEKAGGAVPDELVPGAVDDRDRAVEDRDERVLAIADLVQQVADGSRALLADLGESSQLRRGEQWARGWVSTRSFLSDGGWRRGRHIVPAGARLTESTARPALDGAADCGKKCASLPATLEDDLLALSTLVRVRSARRATNRCTASTCCR